MTSEDAIKYLRRYIGTRYVHHQRCESHRVKTAEAKAEACDCYAKQREMSHVALDVLERLTKGKAGK